MHYILLEGILYYSNGTDYGKVQSDNTVTTGYWGSVAPTFSFVSGSGTVPIGTYRVVVTGEYGDGRETPAAVSETTLAAIGGFGVDIDAHPDALVDSFNVYVSRPDGGAGNSGETAFKAISAANTNGALIPVNSLSSTGIVGGAAGTLNMAGMPHGKFPCFYRGRMYVASGSYILYSEPWMYELTKTDHNFIHAGATVTNLLPVENGIWVSTSNESFFMFGKDPTADGGFEKVSTLAGYGVSGGVIVDGNRLGLSSLSPGKMAVWPTETGIVVGDANGRFLLRTGEFWVPDGSSGKGGFVREVDGEYIYLFHVGATKSYAVNLMTSAVTTFSTVCNSYSTLGGVLVAGNTQGVCEMDTENANDFNGEAFESAVAASFSKTGISFDDSYVKKFTDLYLHMLCNGNLSVQIASETGNGTATLSDGIATLHGSKVDLPRGIRGRNLAFTVSNVSGVHFEIHEIDMEVEVSQNRRSRQNNG
jgi:hypothetical protein